MVGALITLRHKGQLLKYIKKRVKYREGGQVSYTEGTLKNNTVTYKIIRTTRCNREKHKEP